MKIYFTKVSIKSSPPNKKSEFLFLLYYYNFGRTLQSPGSPSLTGSEPSASLMAESFELLCIIYTYIDKMLWL